MVISTEDSIDRNFKFINGNAIDKLVWKRTYLWRALLGMSQRHFDIELNATFQQVQKNEPCACRISNWRLLDISQM